MYKFPFNQDILDRAIIIFFFKIDKYLKRCCIDEVATNNGTISNSCQKTKSSKYLPESKSEKRRLPHLIGRHFLFYCSGTCERTTSLFHLADANVNIESEPFICRRRRQFGSRFTINLNLVEFSSIS